MRFIAKSFIVLALSMFGFPIASMVHADDGYSAYGKHNRVQASRPESYSQREVLDAGHQFFGSISGGIATFIEKVFAKHGQPNGYVLGQQGSGAFIAGVKYGEGQLHTRNAGEYKVYWQGPSIGWDVGADGTRVMMLVYDLPSVDSIYQQYNGVNTSAFLIGGAGADCHGKQVHQYKDRPGQERIGCQAGSQSRLFEVYRPAEMESFLIAADC